MNILAAVDRSEISRAVLDMTIRIAGGIGADVLLVNVAPRAPDALGQQIKRKVISDPVPEELLDRRELLDRHAAELIAAGIDCDTLLIRGNAGRTLLREAERWGANLIIMGSHGRGALYRKVMGSVSEAVMQGRRFPVLVVPAPDAD
ncbi:MAG: universal stress protein [Gammaproteobacteria bacterium]